MRRALLVLGVLCLVTPGVARASMDCTVYWAGRYETWLLPAADATDVPTDTLIWSIGDSLDGGCEEPLDVALLDPDGEPIALVEEGRMCAGPHSVIAWRPLAELSPGASYTIAPGEPVYAADGRLEPQRFTVGPGPAEALPNVPSPLARHVYVEATGLHGGCGGSYRSDHVIWELDSDAPILLLAGGPEDRGRDPAPGSIWSELADFSAEPEVVVEGRLQPTTRIDVRFGAADLAGNFSGWSQPEAVTMPAAGCTSSIRYDEAWLGALALLLGGAQSIRKRRGTRYERTGELA